VAVLGDLINVFTFQKAKTNLGLAEVIGCAPVAFATELQSRFFKHPIEHDPMCFGKN
jgi:hypothetical protein